MNEPIYVRGNLGKTILQLAAQFSDGPSAIWEYVVNSLEYRSQPDGCRINVQIDKKKIIISDNSDGMNLKSLENFFTISGENLARKGQQNSWMKRGLFGTGKTAAFGIGNNLIVETTKDGLRNSYKLSRKAIENSPQDAQSIPLEHLIKDEKTDEHNGTTVTIEGLNIDIKVDKVIRKIEREIAPLRQYDVKVAVNNHVCEFKQLDIIKTQVYESSGAIRERYGDFSLTVEISKTPLDESERGIKVMCNNHILGLEDCGVSSKECGNQITGKVDIPKLEDPIDNVTPFNQTRSHKLNMNHKGVKELVMFMGPKLELIRKELIDNKNKERDSIQNKKLTAITDQLSDKFNKQWNDLKRQLNEIRTGSNAKNVNSFFTEPGEDDELTALISGDEVPAVENEYREGEEGPNIPPVDPPEKELNRDDEDGEKIAKETSGNKVQRRKGGFMVDHDDLGIDEHRSIYSKDELKIIINTEHPSVASCLKSCNNDVENIAFKRLIFEIAFREFEHAIAQEMISDNDMYPASDLLYEMRAHYDKIARIIGSDLYNA